MPSLAHAERVALLDLLSALGPDAPTLCGGWTTHDLAAHLVVRERRPLAVPGLVVPALRGFTARMEQAARPRPYSGLLAALRSGPPAWSPVGAPLDALDDLGNLHEFYVHLEDVRRAGGAPAGPRPLAPALQDALWRRCRLLAGPLTRPARGLGLRLATPDGRTLRVRGTGGVTVHGTPGELLLWLYGRYAVADVTLEGDDGRLAAALGCG